MSSKKINKGTKPSAATTLDAHTNDERLLRYAFGSIERLSKTNERLTAKIIEVPQKKPWFIALVASVRNWLLAGASTVILFLLPAYIRENFPNVAVSLEGAGLIESKNPNPEYSAPHKP